jgi:hypothetical protein
VNGTANRWLFIFVMLLWLAGLPIALFGAIFMELSLKSLAIILIYGALPVLAHRELIRAPKAKKPE